MWITSKCRNGGLRLPDGGSGEVVVMQIDWDKLEREAEMGRQVLAYLNRLELRKQEDRQYVEQIRRCGRELVESYQAGRAKGAGA
jgi:hypothetical protein